MAEPVEKKEEMAIVKAIKDGKSINQVAKDFKRSSNTVSRYAKKHNLKIARARTKKATEAAQFYNKEKRMELLKIAFEKAKELMEESGKFTANDMRNVSMALGILIDKQRLEEGEVTDRTENNGEMVVNVAEFSDAEETN